MALKQYLIDVTSSKSKHQMSKICKTFPFIPYSFLVPLGPQNFSSAGTINFSSAGTFLHLNGIKTVPDRCYPFKVQTSNEQNLQDIPFYTLLIFSSAGAFNFSSAGTINFSSAGTIYFSSAGTFNFSSAGTFNFSSAGTFLHLNGTKTVPDRCYSFKVQTSNEQNLQDIPFYTLLIFSSAVTFNFSSAGPNNFSSAVTFLHLDGTKTVPDRCHPFKVETSNEQYLQDFPFYTLLIFSSAFSSAVTFNFSSAGPNNFSSAGTFLHLNGIKTVPDRCYPSKSKHQMSKICKTFPFIPYSFLVLLGPLILVLLGPLILVLLGPLILVLLGPLILVPLGPLILVPLGPFCT